MSKQNKKEGAGFMDVLRDPVGTIKEALNPIPTKLNNISTRTLQQYGNQPIMGMDIARTPLNKIWTNALNVLSFGKFEEFQKKHGYDKMFHLSLIVTLPNAKIIIEKNEVVHIAPFESSAVNDQTQYFKLYPRKGLTITSIIDKTLQRIGPEKFYDYDAFTNNCQFFIRNILMNSGLLSQQAYNFLFQNISGIAKDLEDSGHGYVHKGLNIITNLGSRVSRLIGKGKSTANDATKEFINFVEQNGMRFL